MAAAASLAGLELIPVVETRGFLRKVDLRPDREAGIAAWQQARDTAVARLGLPALTGAVEGADWVRLEKLSDAHLRILVEEHLRDPQAGDFWTDEPVALFGGFWLRQAGQTLHLPHCCGTLGDFHAWLAVPEPEVEAAWMAEGHPGLSWRRLGDGKIAFDQGSDFEPAPEGLPEAFTLSLRDLSPLILAALRMLQRLDATIAGWQLPTPYADIADRLVWACDPGEGSRGRMQATLERIGAPLRQ